MLNNKVSAVFVVHGLAEARLNLFCDVEVVKDRYLAGIHLHDVCFFRCNKSYIVLYIFVNFLIVDVDVLERWIEEVA